MAGTITAKMSTGEVTTKYPETKEVFARYFGAGCFTCPAFGSEPVEMACMMHGTDVEKFVKELNEAASKK